MPIEPDGVWAGCDYELTISDRVGEKPMQQHKQPPELTELDLADLKRDLNNQLHKTESHLTKLRSLLSELEEQNRLLQEIIITSNNPEQCQ